MRRWPQIAAFLLTLAFTLSAHAHPLTSASAPETAPRGVKIQIREMALADVSNCLQLKGKSASSRTFASGQLFTGEQSDPNVGFYYLRARYYSPANGRFPTMDTWMGIMDSPATLHKYVYVHASPTNWVDPSGHYTSAFGRRVERVVCNQYLKAFPQSLPGLAECGKGQYVGPFYSGNSYLKPDIFDFVRMKFAEVKPFSLSGISSGKIQIAAYSAAFGPFNPIWQYSPMTRETEWVPKPVTVGNTNIWFFNSEGVIFYTDNETLAKQTASVALASLAVIARNGLKRIGTRVSAGAVITAGRNIIASAAVVQGRLLASMRPVTRYF